MLKLRDIHNMEFRTTFRGYDPEQVDQFISKLLNEYETLYRECEEQKKTIESLRQQLGEMEQEISNFHKREDSIQELVGMARRTVDEVLSSAKAESEGILASAHREADRIVVEAKKEAEHLIATAHMEKQTAARESEQLQQLQERLYYRIQRVLDDAKEALEEIRPEKMSTSVAFGVDQQRTREISSLAAQEIASTRRQE